MSEQQPQAEQANQGGVMSKLKKTLLFLLVLGTGAIIAIATIKYFPTVNEKVDAAIAKVTGSTTANVNSNQAPPPPAGLDVDKHKAPSRRTQGEETVANANGSVALSPLLKDVRRHKPEEILRRGDLLVDGKLPSNLNRLWIYMPQLTEVPTDDTGKVSHHYRLDYQSIADANLNLHPLNGKRFDVVHHKEVEGLSNDLDPGQRYFFAPYKVKFVEDGDNDPNNDVAILEIPTGFAPGAGRLDNRTTTTFHGVKTPPNVQE